MKKKVLQYLILGVLCVLTPYFSTITLVMITGDRYSGMTYGVIPGIILVHLVYGFLYTRNKLVSKILWSIVLSVIIFLIVLVSSSYKIIETKWDLYGFWDLAVTNFLVGVIVWEAFYQINKLVEK